MLIAQLRADLAAARQALAAVESSPKSMLTEQPHTCDHEQRLERCTAFNKRMRAELHQADTRGIQSFVALKGAIRRTLDMRPD